MKMTEIETHECEVCGHKGPDVEWQGRPHKSGYFCRGLRACFERYRQQRSREPGTVVTEDDGEA